MHIKTNKRVIVLSVDGSVVGVFTNSKWAHARLTEIKKEKGMGKIPGYPRISLSMKEGNAIEHTSKDVTVLIQPINVNC